MIVLFAVSSARAVDCAKATSNIDKAICGDDSLRKIDRIFNNEYAELVGLADQFQRRELEESQGRWLKETDAACGRKSGGEIVECARNALRKRRDEIARAFSDGKRFGVISLGRAGLILRVGNAKLEVVSPPTKDDIVQFQLVHGNTLVAESQAPFEIDGRGGDDTAEAVVISTHNYGNLGCSEQYLIVAPGRRTSTY